MKKSSILNFISENPKRQICFLIFLSLALIVMTTIFYFSAQTAEKSTKIESVVAEKQTEVLEKVLKNTNNVKRYAVVHWFEVWIRKIAHVLNYGALGFFLLGAFLNIDKIKKLYIKLLLPLGIGLIYGATDEIHQMFVRGRNASFSDIGIDFLGVLIGTVFMLICYGIFKLFAKKRQKEV